MKIKKIGGSYFLHVPPEYVKVFGLLNIKNFKFSVSKNGKCLKYTSERRSK